MRKLTKYYSDGRIVDDFSGVEVKNNEISFYYEQKFPFPQVSIFSEISGEIDRVNFQVKKLSDHSIKIKFMEDLKDQVYTIKIL